MDSAAKDMHAMAVLGGVLCGDVSLGHGNAQHCVCIEERAACGFEAVVRVAHAIAKFLCDVEPDIERTLMKPE